MLPLYESGCATVHRERRLNVSGDDTTTSHIKRGEAAQSGAGFLTNALLSQVAFVKVKATNNAAHLLTNALQSSAALYEWHYIIYSRAIWVHFF